MWSFQVIFVAVQDTAQSLRGLKPFQKNFKDAVEMFKMVHAASRMER